MLCPALIVIPSLLEVYSETRHALSEMNCEQPNCARRFASSRSFNLHLRFSKTCKKLYQNRYVQFSSDSNGSDTSDGDASDRSYEDDRGSGEGGDNKSVSSESSSAKEEISLKGRVRKLLQHLRTKRRRSSTNPNHVSDSPSLAASDDEADVPASDDDPPPVIPVRCTDKHPTAGQSHGKGQNTLERISLAYFVEQRKTNIYYPFQNKDDWEVAAWLSNSNLSMSEIDRFLKLPFVRTNFFFFLDGR